MEYWIFQSVDHTFKLPEALKEAPRHGNVLGYQANRYSAKIKRDDTVYLYFAGKRSPGLYATATVKSGPDEIPPEEWESKFDVPSQANKKPKQPKKKQLWVRLKIERLLEQPCARRDVIGLSEMAPTQFVKTHGNGTNFRLTPEQASAIDRLIPAPRALGDPKPAAPRSSNARLAAPKSVRSQPNRLPEHS